MTTTPIMSGRPAVTTEYLDQKEKELRAELDKVIQQIGEYQALMNRIQGALAFIADLKKPIDTEAKNV